MNRRVLIASVWLLTAACGPTPSPTDGSTADGQDASSIGFFMDRYHPATDCSAATTATAALATLEESAENDHWDAVESGIASGTAAEQLLSRLDTEFVQNPSTSEFSLLATVRRGVMLGRAATTDDDRDVAHETVGKILAVSRALATISALRSSVTQMTSGQGTMARATWDCAATYFVALEPLVREYQPQMVTNVWGPGRNAISSDNIADTLVDMLVRGAAAIDAMQTRGVIEAGNEADLYLSRLFVSMSAKYVASLEDATTAMTTLDPGWHPEGMYALEGVIDPYVGLDETTAAAARGHWRTMPFVISRAQHLRDLGGIYAAANSARLQAFASATDNDRYATVARFRGTVGALEDAFSAAGDDPAALLMQVDTARMRVEANDVPGASSALQMVQDAVTRMASGM
jgi:hypothetical protein